MLLHSSENVGSFSIYSGFLASYAAFLMCLPDSVESLYLTIVVMEWCRQLIDFLSTDVQIKELTDCLECVLLFLHFDKY